VLTDRRFLRLTVADGLFLVGLGLLVSVTVSMIHYPNLLRLESLTAQRQEQELTSQELASLNAAIARARRNTDLFEHRLAGYEDRIFKSTDPGLYLETISSLQERCGISVGQIDPHPPQRDGPYEVRPVRIVADGPFPQILHFVHQLKAELWSGELRDLRIEAQPNSPTCRLTLNVQFHVESDGAAPATKPNRPSPDGEV